MHGEEFELPGGPGPLHPSRVEGTFMGTTNLGNCRLVNLTPHDVTLLVADEDGRESPVVFLPSGHVARVTTCLGDADLNGHDVGWLRRSSFGELVVSSPKGGVNLFPEPDRTGSGTLWLVSAVVAAALRRPDVVSPGDVVRDAAGQVVACRCLLQHT